MIKFIFILICFFISACTTWDKDRVHSENGKNSIIYVKSAYCATIQKNFDSFFSEAINVSNDLQKATKSCVLNGPNNTTYLALKQKTKDLVHSYLSAKLYFLESEKRKEFNSCFNVFNASKIAYVMLDDGVIKNYSGMTGVCSEKIREMFENAVSARAYSKDIDVYVENESREILDSEIFWK